MPISPCAMSRGFKIKSTQPVRMALLGIPKKEAEFSSSAKVIHLPLVAASLLGTKFVSRQSGEATPLHSTVSRTIFGLVFALLRLV